MNDIMRRIIFLFIVFSGISYCFPGIAGSIAAPEGNRYDTIDIQTLYNGRAWRNLYHRIRGDQFLFSSGFMPGSVVINDKEFNNLQVRYDIYNDELLTITDRGIIIQLNKEMIDFFSMEYNNKVFHFKNIDADSLSSLSGYVNVLYDGKTPLYVKYRKEILLLAVENKYDLFNQINKIYLQKYGKFIQINSKKEFLGILKDQKQQVHNFIKTNNIRISKKNPESFKPVIEYYDKLRQ
jgi:hypothetical protein